MKNKRTITLSISEKAFTVLEDKSWELRKKKSHLIEELILSLEKKSQSTEDEDEE